MKGRPRSIENKVAAWITELSAPKGYKAVERIPVLGRTGPDLTINELGLVVDVKSRLEVPKSVFMKPLEMIDFGGLIGIRLDHLDLLMVEYKATCIRGPSVLVRRWFDHMDEWRQENYPQGVTALVLHRPGRHVGTSTVIISSEQRSILYGS